ncbi:CHAT domain-containing protein [Paludibaculum fermentans]|uniref:CHAT domain-containing protein n=1 Tax=Paludibaculum fermentans TaxID=1473598 RepID=A0A7S7NLB3_PALFE|nr:CHAT domain-containing tetratricopeptide repeat protein [Paludibaculum fermentans]QOY85184.1 CHAT domain-containing protein [Paludibaculum fermentans]
MLISAVCWGQGVDDAQALNKAGGEFLYGGEYEKALDAFGKARSLFHERGEVRQEAVSWVNIGAVHFYRGRYVEAWDVYNRAATMAEERAGEPWVPDVLQFVDVNRAALLQKLGKDHDALDIYLKLRRAGQKLEAGEEARVLANLGALYRRLGDPYKALETERASVALFRQVQDVDGQLGAMKNIAIAQAMEFQDYSAARAGFAEALALAHRSGNKREELQCELYLGEALFRTGDEAGARLRWQSVLDNARSLKLPEEQWKALYGLGRVDHDRSQWQAAAAVIESTRADLRRAELRGGFLADKRDVFDALIESAASDAERLDWLERSRGRTTLPLPQLRGKVPAGSALLVYWVGRKQAGVLKITQAGSQWSAIHLPARTASDVLPPLDGIHRLVLVPDGTLAGVAFDALAWADGTKVVERYETWSLPSSTFLPAAARKTGARWPWEAQLLGIGDPEVRTALPGDPDWAHLPRAAAELVMVSKQLNGQADLRVKSEARKQALNEARDFRVIHLATHAAADFENPARSRILFSGPEYLYLRDVVKLDLRGVELVTLSACETEAGAAARGDSPMSLARAFLESGAGSVVGSLWAVRDEAAADFMQRFYRELSNGTPRGAAVRTAKLEMMQKGAPVEDWAAFVLSGDGLSPLTPYWSWSVLLSGAAATLAAAGLALSLRTGRRG